MSVHLGKDSSYFKFHTSDATFNIATATPKDTDNKDIALAVDTGTWYVWYENVENTDLNGFYAQ